MFQSVKSGTSPERIIGQIRKAIFEGELNPGDRLSPERELMRTFKVSKSTLREALRSLEVLGFLEIRKGVAGGPFVTEVDLRKARDCFSNFLRFKNLSLKNLFEVLLIIEPYLAEKAALAITEEDLEKLDTLNKECDNRMRNDSPIDPRKHEIEYHRILAGVFGNPILSFILDFGLDLLLETKEALEPGQKFARKHLRAHKKIYKALLERNPTKAREEMIRHINEVERDLLTLRKKAPHGILWIKTDSSTRFQNVPQATGR